MEHIDESTAAQRAEELSDEELIALSRSGEAWAEEALCERHKTWCA